MTPVFYDYRQSLLNVDSFSPSAAKPARFVKLLEHHRFSTTGDFGECHSFAPVKFEDLMRVHKPEHVQGIFAQKIMNGFDNYDKRVPWACLWTIGSLLAAARCALGDPVISACSPTSGFHHAGYDFAGGYCTFNGLMVVAARLLHEQPQLRIGILDCDTHYGNGTDHILKLKPLLAKQIMHRSSGKHFHGDEPEVEALAFQVWLHHSIEELNGFGCDLVLYQAGADMHKDDPLGGFLDDGQLIQRDRMVFEGLRCGIAWNLAGGYRGSRDIHADPVLRTHLNTLMESNRACRGR